MKKAATLALTLLSVAQAGGGQPTPDPLQPLLDFARSSPQNLAVQISEVSPDGTLKPLLAWNPTQAMPLASSRKIVVLAAYAEAVAEGRLNPRTAVKLVDWENYYLPQLDGGAHAASLKALGLKTNQLGGATQPEATVPLDTLARFMIETSDNAATDYLMVTLGQAALQQTINRFDLNAQELLSPLSGWMASLALTPQYTEQDLMARHDGNWTMAEKLSRQPELRLKVLEAVGKLSTAELTARLDQTDTRGTVADYNRVMAQVVSGHGFQPTELAVMRRHLGWPTRLLPALAKSIAPWYAKGGSLPGILTNNYAFVPQTGPHKGKMFVASAFLRQIPASDTKKLNAVLASDGLILLSLSEANRQKLAQALRP